MAARISPAFWREVDFRKHVLDRLDAIDSFIKKNLMSTEFKTKENPQAIKPAGEDENLSLRNLAARENQRLCFCGRDRSGHEPSMSCFQYDD